MSTPSRSSSKRASAPSPRRKQAAGISLSRDTNTPSGGGSGNFANVAIAPDVVSSVYRHTELAFLAALGVSWIFFGLSSRGFHFAASVGLVFASALVSSMVIHLSSGYRLDALIHPLKALFLSLSTALLYSAMMTMASGFADGSYRFLWPSFASVFLMSSVAILTGRVIMVVLASYWYERGVFFRRIAFVGGAPEAEDIIRSLRQAGASMDLVGIFDDRSHERAPDELSGVAKLGRVDDLVAYARQNRVDVVLFTLPLSAEGRILQMLKKLSVLPVDVRMAAHRQGLSYRKDSYTFLGQVPTLALLDRPISDGDYVLKWLFDKIVGGLALFVLSPVMLLTALAIRLESPGSILFKQKRYGFNNELIEVYKFRSMYTHMTDAQASKLVTKDDPRVTRVGRIIRKTSLDELPQLFNVVFKGNLSLVGPRPHAEKAKAANVLYYEAVDGYFTRHKVKPGITGWAQIHGWRGETDTLAKIQGRFEHDLYYIENWSLWLDALILLRTPFALLKTEQAY